MLYDDGIIIRARKFPQGLFMRISRNSNKFNSSRHIRSTSPCYITGGLL
jgi:hypothetical protein